MFVESGWKPDREPPKPKPGMSDRDERVLMGLILVVAALLLLAPIGGGTILQAVGAF